MSDSWDIVRASEELIEIERALADLNTIGGQSYATDTLKRSVLKWIDLTGSYHTVLELLLPLMEKKRASAREVLRKTLTEAKAS